MHRELQDWMQVSADEQSCTPECSGKAIHIQRPLCTISNANQTVHDPKELDKNESSVSTSLEEPPPAQLTWVSLDPLKRRFVYDICPKVQS